MTNRNIFSEHVLSVSCGYSNLLVLTYNGLYEIDYTTKVKQILKFHNIRSFVCGGSHIIVLTTKGLYSWGSNRHLQLGTIDSKNNLIPFFKPDDIISIYAGRDNSFALTKEGLYAWGDNEYGQLGLGYNKNIVFPPKAILIDYKNISSLCCPWKYTIFLTKDNNFYECGYSVTNFPVRCTFFDKYEIISISSSNTHTLVLTSLGLYIRNRNTLSPKDAPEVSTYSRVKLFSKKRNFREFRFPGTLINRWKYIRLLFIARDKDVKSPFHKDYLPFDMFKEIIKFI